METAELVEKIDQVFNRKKQANEEAFRKRFPRDHRYVSQKMLSFVPKPASLKSDIGSGSIGEPLGPENVLTLSKNCYETLFLKNVEKSLGAVHI